MYAYTKPGEVKKRVPGPEDLNKLLALYEGSEDPDAGAQGCAIAAGRASGAMGCWLLGLTMIAFGARKRRRRRAGPSLSLAVSLFVVALPSSADTPTVSVEVAYEAQLRIHSVAAHFEGGLVVSEMELAAESCEGQCDEVPQRIKVYGGTVGDITQTVGHVPTPTLGQQVIVRAINTEDSGRQVEVAPLAVAAAH